MDREGKYALLCGSKEKAGQRRPFDPSDNLANTPMRFALVNLGALKTLDTRSVTTGIQLAVLDDKYVYMVLASGNVLYRLDRDDLTKRRRVFLSGNPRELAATPDHHLAVMLYGEHQSSIEMFDRETLQRTPKHFGERAAEMSPDVPPFWEPAGDGGLRFDAWIVDSRTGARVAWRERPACRSWPTCLTARGPMSTKTARRGYGGASLRVAG